MNLKKCSALILGLILIFALTACGEPESLSDNENVKVISIDYAIPEDFKVLDEENKVYVTVDYPADSSKLVMTESKKTKNFLDMTEKDYKNTFDGQIKQDGKVAEVKVTKFDRCEVSGFRAINATAEFSFEKKTVTMKQLMIDADKSYIITFMNSGTTDRSAEIDKMFKNIKIKYEK